MNFPTRRAASLYQSCPVGFGKCSKLSQTRPYRDDMLPQRPPAYEYARIRASHALRIGAERIGAERLLFVVGATPHDPWRRPGRLVSAGDAVSVSVQNPPYGPRSSTALLRTNPAQPISPPSMVLDVPLGFLVDGTMKVRSRAQDRDFRVRRRAARGVGRGATGGANPPVLR